MLLKATMIAGVGGFVGTCLRFLSEQLGAILCHGAFPLGTFMANILGCWLIGLFYGWATNREWFGKKLNLLLITGLCGGFTTFSSFSEEMISLLQAGNSSMFVLYLLSTLILGLLAVIIGIAMVSKSTKTPETAQS